MKITHLTIATLVLCAGCQTRITAEKHPEAVHPIYAAAPSNSTLYVCGYYTSSGGWYATARSPLWATEELRGLDIGVATNGNVNLSLGEYRRDLSTNAVAITRIMVDGAVDLTAKVASACITGGASASGDAAISLAKKAVKLFTSKGGDVSRATLTCADGSCTFTDGSATVKCANGECTYIDENGVDVEQL